MAHPELEKRLERINQVAQYLYTLASENPDKKVLPRMMRNAEMWAMATIGVNQSKAREYVRIARWKLENPPI